MNISPKITKLTWGSVTIEGGKTFKDVKLFPGGAREWNWNKTGTEHFPGIQYSDVQELIENGAEEIVLSRGVLGRLKVQDDLVSRLENEGKIVHVHKTKKAVEVYNSLVNSKNAGALIHSTC